MNRKPEATIIWDIDGTLMPGSLERAFVDFLAEQQMVSRGRMLRRMLARLLRHPRSPWTRVKLAYLRGERAADVEAWAEDCWRSRLVDALRPGAVEAVRYATGAGTLQLLLSGAPEPLARRLAAHLALEHLVAARPEVHDGLYTGGLTEPHPHGKYKLAYADRWLRARRRTWQGTIACADHPGDRYLLERVEQAVAVEPRPGLQSLARRRGWTTVRDAELPELVRRLLDR